MKPLLNNATRRVPVLAGNYLHSSAVADCNEYSTRRMSEFSIRNVNESTQTRADTVLEE